MSNAPAEPTALEVVAKTLRNLRTIGSEMQKRDAAQIERTLGLGAPRVVNFARRPQRPESAEAKK